jgi:hypothetical protein
MTAEIQFAKSWNPVTKRFTYDPTGLLNVETHTLFATGPIAGVITLDDGTQYDVTEDYVGVRIEHAEELGVRIKVAHNAEGRFLDVPAAPEGEASPTDE